MDLKTCQQKQGYYHVKTKHTVFTDDQRFNHISLMVVSLYEGQLNIFALTLT